MLTLIFIDLLGDADSNTRDAHDSDDSDTNENNGIVDGGRMQCDVKLARTHRKQILISLCA